MNKKRMDVQLIEACILEKWNPIAVGCFATIIAERESDTCVLCQVYNNYSIQFLHRSCKECPVCKRTGSTFCEGTPFIKVMRSCTPDTYYDNVEAEIEFLISLLPKDHKWKNE